MDIHIARKTKISKQKCRMHDGKTTLAGIFHVVSCVKSLHLDSLKILWPWHDLIYCLSIYKHLFLDLGVSNSLLLYKKKFSFLLCRDLFITGKSPSAL